MTPPDEDDGLQRETDHEVRDLTARVVLLEAKQGRIAWGWQATAVAFSAMMIMSGAVAFMVRVDARQEEQSRALQATVARLDGHISTDAQQETRARVEALRHELDQIEGKGSGR